MELPPDIIEGEEEYEVERILNSRRHGRGRKLQFLIRWKGYSSAHDSWEDATGVNAPALLEEYYQRKATAVRTIEDKREDCTVNPAASSLHPSTLSTPISISRISFMSNGPSQGLFGTIPVDERTTIPYWELNSWWHQPEQPHFWLTPDNDPDEQQRHASYFPEIPVDYPEIPNEPGLSNPFEFELPQLPCPNSDATTIEIPTERQTNHSAPRTPGQEKAVPDPINKRRYAYTAERHPDGQFKKRSQPPGTTIPDLTAEPPQPAQPAQNLDDSSVASNSNTSRPRGVCPKPRDRVCTSKVSSPPSGRSITGSAES
jgi:hypothetical protein